MLSAFGPAIAARLVGEGVDVGRASAWVSFLDIGQAQPISASAHSIRVHGGG